MVSEKRRIDGDPGCVFPKNTAQNEIRRHAVVHLGEKQPLLPVDEINLDANPADIKGLDLPLTAFNIFTELMLGRLPDVNVGTTSQCQGDFNMSKANLQ